MITLLNKNHYLLIILLINFINFNIHKYIIHHMNIFFKIFLNMN